MNTPKTTHDYRTHLTLSNGTNISISGPERKGIEDSINRLFQRDGQPVRFEEGKDGEVYAWNANFSDSVPVCVINELTELEYLSSKPLIETRLKTLRAA